MVIYDIHGNPITASVNSGLALAQHIVENPNLANPNLFTAGLLNATGGINTANSSGATTDYIPCSPGQIVTVGGITGYNHNPWFVATGANYNCYGYYFYDSNKTGISGAISRPSVSSGITVPDGASYIRVSFFGDAAAGGVYYDTNPEMAFVHVADKNITAPMYYFDGNVETVLMQNPAQYIGKTWVLFGDSLTDSYGGHGWDMETSPIGGEGWRDTENGRVEWTGYFWASRIAREHGLVIDNRAHSGSNIYVTTGGTYSDVNGVATLNAFLEEIDTGTIEKPYIITVGFGTNHENGAEGTNEDDSTVTTSAYGATKYFIEKIREKCPESILLFILPPEGDWQGGFNKNIDVGRETIKSVCDDYKVPYCNMLTESGITANDSPDKIHTVASIEGANKYYRALNRYM